MSLPARWANAIGRRLAEIQKMGRWRTVRTLAGGEPHTRLDDRAVVSFASNDYLGLTQHPAVRAAATEAIERWGSGSGSARLIVGGRPPHDELEVALAVWKQRDAALLFSTGYQANVGVLGALAAAAPGTVIHSDELNHASIIDGARLARADVCVYPHLDLRTLADQLSRDPDRPHLVVTDSVFSMDGDLAPVDELAELCAAHDALLVLDEAHAVLGPTAPPDAVIVGTASKALGSLGGFVAATTEVIDLCRNVARSFIFTTASTPADTAAALAALRIVTSAEGDALRERLRSHIGRLLPLRADHPSPIIPVMLGTEDRAVTVAGELLKRGLLVPAIRPPTVPAGSCRLRVALSAAHTDDDIDQLAGALSDLGVRP